MPEKCHRRRHYDAWIFNLILGRRLLVCACECVRLVCMSVFVSPFPLQVDWFLGSELFILLRPPIYHIAY